MASLCADFLHAYPNKDVSFSSNAPQFRSAKRVEAELHAVASRLVANRHWKTRVSCGQGNWTNVPWAAVFDTRETSKASEGVYPVIHFLLTAQDGTPQNVPGLRLGLNVAVSQYTGNSRERRVLEVASELQRANDAAPELAPFWIATDSTARPTARPKGGLAKDYYEGMILEEFLSVDALRENPGRLEDDLAHVLRMYVDWVAWSHEDPARCFLSEMQAYKDEGAVFRSRVQGKHYAIQSVDEGGCTTERLSGGNPSRCSITGFQSLLAHARTANEIDLTGVYESVDRVEVATYAESPHLLLSRDGRSLRYVEDTDEICDHFCDLLDSLRVDNDQSGQPRLYKPAMLAAILEAIDSGDITTNRIELSSIRQSYQDKLNTLGISPTEEITAQPFFYLSGEPFWILCYRDPRESIALRDSFSSSQLRDAVTHARLSQPFWDMLQSASHRHRARTALTNRWFSQHPPQATHMKQPLNEILYGPPGTGKTFKAIRTAVSICDATTPTTEETLSARFEALRREGRIEMVTFHQSYGYEEFIEGLRPVLTESDDESTGSSIAYECRPGLLRSIVARATGKVTSRAKFNANWDGNTIWKMSLGNTQRSSDADIYDECLENNYVLLGWGGDIDYAGCDSEDAIRQRQIENPPAQKDFSAKAVDRLKNQMTINDLIVVSEGNTRFRAIGRVSGEYEYIQRDRYSQMRPVEWLVVYDDAVPRETIYRRSFSQGTLYKLDKRALQMDALEGLLQQDDSAEARKFVLIIDEINRGNIAKILGELITLLEPDKRIGATNEIRLTLPYSGKSFSLPDNLFILGTMNTADRSIAFLDVALRRRFEFKEIMPDSGVVRSIVGNNGEVGGVHVDRLLDAMNERIELLFDRDHQIGHSFFLNVQSLADLRRVLTSAVIPLLQEYFVGDWGKVALVLGCPFDPESGTQLSKNPLPLLYPEMLDPSKLLSGDTTDYDPKVRCNINPGFLDANESELAKFFDAIPS